MFVSPVTVIVSHSWHLIKYMIVHVRHISDIAYIDTFGGGQKERPMYPLQCFTFYPLTLPPINGFKQP